MTENQRVRYLRKELLKMTGTEFGKKIGVQNTAISKIELGENNLTDQARMLICSTFGVREAWLRDGEGEPFNVPDSRDEEIADFVAHALSDRSPEIQRTFLHVLSKLTDEQWAALADIAEALVEEQLRQQDEDAALDDSEADSDEDEDESEDEAQGFTMGM